MEILEEERTISANALRCVRFLDGSSLRGGVNCTVGLQKKHVSCIPKTSIHTTFEKTLTLSNTSWEGMMLLLHEYGKEEGKRRSALGRSAINSLTIRKIKERSTR